MKMDKEDLGGKADGVKASSLMVVVQVAFAAANIMYKLAADDGMNMQVMVAYRFLFATAFMVPLAIVFERKKQPTFTWKILLEVFLCGLLGGTLEKNFNAEALNLTSPTFVSAMSNLIPAITFLLAICFRMETLRWREKAGQAKMAGTLLGIGGAMLLTFYKGPVLELWPSTHIDLLAHHSHHGRRPPPTSGHGHDHGQRHTLGALLSLGSCFSYALWLICQAKLNRRYPGCPYSVTAMMCVVACVQSVGLGLFVERDWEQWKLGCDVRLLTVAYSGIVASGLMVVLISWCVSRRGPLFVSIFNPLLLVTVAVAASLLLNDKLCLGSVLGSALIICGLYGVIWGKGQESKSSSENEKKPPPGVSRNVVVPVTDADELPPADDGDHKNPKQGEVVVVISVSALDDRDEKSTTKAGQKEEVEDKEVVLSITTLPER
ncbi:unnamed protein product [Linum trigynum]|uniref:EamA domain-containing protein n=1 Tax=Linum trigynum TaxID=586398 RepID=A0AAV2C8K8_9ROSI